MAHVDEEIARLISEDGYYVVARNDRQVELERKNSWLAVLLTGVLSGSGPGLSRTNRLYLVVDAAGEAVMQLHPPRGDDEPSRSEN